MEGWPAGTPGAANAWLLMITTKSPVWRDNLITWPQEGPALGDPHEGFFYPDPLGFWAEVRRWATVVLGCTGTGWDTPDALAVSALFHVGENPERLAWATDRLRPACILFLDEPSWSAASPTTGDLVRTSVPDPHRPGQAYEGWWGRSGDVVVGKSPQHPTMHRLYQASEMDRFLRSIPITQLS